MINKDEKKTRVTIYEVAKHAGVSLATVSRVINNSASVSEETKTKVNEVINRLGYKPSVLAQGLATSKSALIGVVIPGANYVYISNLLNGIQQIAKANNFNILLFTTLHSKVDATKAIEDVIKSHVDGVIVFDDVLTSEDIANMNSYSVPVVIINHSVTTKYSACVLFNHDEIIRKITWDNVTHNGKRMNFLHTRNGGRLLNRVEKIFVNTMVSAKGDYSIITTDDSYNAIYEDMKEHFKFQKSGYYICYRDSIAAAVVDAAIDTGLRIPQDVEVLSLIGTKYANIIRPNITNLYVDFFEVGKRAMEMLIDLSKDTLSDRIAKFNVVLKKGNTTIDINNS